MKKYILISLILFCYSSYGQGEFKLAPTIEGVVGTTKAAYCLPAYQNNEWMEEYLKSVPRLIEPASKAVEQPFEMWLQQKEIQQFSKYLSKYFKSISFVDISSKEIEFKSILNAVFYSSRTKHDGMLPPSRYKRPSMAYGQICLLLEFKKIIRGNTLFKKYSPIFVTDRNNKSRYCLSNTIKLPEDKVGKLSKLLSKKASIDTSISFYPALCRKGSVGYSLHGKLDLSKAKVDVKNLNKKQNGKYADDAVLLWVSEPKISLEFVTDSYTVAMIPKGHIHYLGDLNQNGQGEILVTDSSNGVMSIFEFTNKSWTLLIEFEKSYPKFDPFVL